ncbi:MAG: hypothetical protein MZW92_01010 [Comamonadaceae bacterium]|nr:hypothetical protein [Comamonadaceae bacterium]
MGPRTDVADAEAVGFRDDTVHAPAPSSAPAAAPLERQRRADGPCRPRCDADQVRQIAQARPAAAQRRRGRRRRRSERLALPGARPARPRMRLRFARRSARRRRR